MKENQPESEITPEMLAEKVSLFMTKPENTDTKAPLLLFLKNNGLQAEVFRFTLNEDLLRKLYPKMETSYIPWVQEATKEYMLDKEVEVFLVTKDNSNDSNETVIQQLAKLVGEETVPDKNPDGTLRKHLSEGIKMHPDKESGKDMRFFRNGFHRPITSEELMENLNAFGLLEEAKKLARES